MKRRRLPCFDRALLVLVGMLVANPVQAEVKYTELFDLQPASAPLFYPREKKLADTTTPPQSFGFDNVNHFVYVAQVSGPTGSNDYLGNLTITKLDLYGNIYGSMKLKNFGHGVSIGVEPSDTKDAWLWVEVDPPALQKQDDPAYGKRLARIRFYEKNWITGGDPLDSRNGDHQIHIERYSPIEGAINTTCSIDMEHGYLLMRYYKEGHFRFALFDLEAVKQRVNTYNGNAQPRVDITQPAPTVWKTHTWKRPPSEWDSELHTLFQGYTSFGSYLYLLEGEMYDDKIDVASKIPNSTTVVRDSETNKPDGNTWLTVVDLNTGEVVARALTKAGYTIARREPEGMAVQTMVLAGKDESYVKKPRLCFGFSSETKPTDESDKTRSDGNILQTAIYYKDTLIDVPSPENSIAEDERCRWQYSRWWKRYVRICRWR